MGMLSCPVLQRNHKRSAFHCRKPLADMPEMHSQDNTLYGNDKAIEQNGSFIPQHHVTYFFSLEGRSPNERLAPIPEALTQYRNSHLRFTLITHLPKGILSFTNTVDKYVFFFLCHSLTDQKCSI